jgi:hypothetical protein
LAGDLLNISKETKKIRYNFGDGDSVFLNKNISFSKSLENLLTLIAPAFVKFFFLIFLIYFFFKKYTQPTKLLYYKHKFNKR